MEKLKYKTIPVDGDENYVVKVIDFKEMPELYGLLEKNIESIHSDGIKKEDFKDMYSLISTLFPDDRMKEFGFDIYKKLDETENLDAIKKINEIYNELISLLQKDNLDGFDFNEKNCFDNLSYLTIALLFLIAFNSSFNLDIISNVSVIVALIISVFALYNNIKLSKYKKDRLKYSEELRSMITEIHDDNEKVLTKYKSCYSK